MPESIKCLHSLKKSTEHPAIDGALKWSTCLRDISFTNSAELRDVGAAVDIYENDDAYKFCLQVICGLQSQLVGETEVFGQFKNFVDSIRGNSHFEHQFRSFANNLMADAKKIRSEFLTGLGSQSYGSLARSWLSQDSAEVHVLGYGHLAQEIEPWLAKRTEKLCFHRRSQIAAGAGQKLSGALIVAAPLSDLALADWLARNECTFATLIDFRDSSKRNTFASKFQRVYVLADAFRKVDSGRVQREQKIFLAQQAIDRLVVARSMRNLHRPFGWDDLCA